MNKKNTKTFLDDNGEVMELDEDWFKKATLHLGYGAKKSINLRCDPLTLGWFQSFGKGYQTRMLAVLKAYAEAHMEAGDA